MKKVIVSLLTNCLALSLLTACGKNTDDEKVVADPVPEEVATIDAAQIENVENKVIASNNAYKKMKWDLYQLEVISEKIGEVVNLNAEVNTAYQKKELEKRFAKGIVEPDMTFVKKRMSVLSLARISNNLDTALLDYNGHMEKPWKEASPDFTTSNGHSPGKMVSSLALEDGLYVYDSTDNYEKEGYYDTLHITLTSKMMRYVDIRSNSDNPKGKLVKHSECLIDENNVLYVATAEFYPSKNETHQLVVYYDGTTLNYARKTIVSDQMVDFDSSMADGNGSWKGLLAYGEFDVISTYNGTDFVIN